MKNNRIRNLSRLAILAALFSSLLFLPSCTRIDAGYTGLKIDLLGDAKGSVAEVPPGRYFNISPNVDYKSFPLFVQTYVWTEGKDEGSPNDEAIRFQTSEGMQIVCDIGVTFAINSEPGTAKSLYLTYRRGVEEIIDSPLRNAVRDAFNKHGSKFTADQIIGEGKNDLMKLVFADIKAQFAPNIQVQSLSYLKSPRPPQNVIDALNAKVQATQLAIQKENEVRAAKAEADKAVETAKGRADAILLEAKAQAEANRLLAASMTPTLVQLKWVEKWNGSLPQVSSSDAGGLIVDFRK